MIKLNYPSMNIVLGSPGSGKSHLMHYLIESNDKKKNIDWIMVITMSPHDYTFIDSKYVIVPRDRTHIDLILQKIFELQNKFRDQNKTKRLLLIFDDCLGVVNFNTPNMLSLNTRFRHYNICLFYITQYINKLPPVIRESAYYAFIFNLKTKRSIETAYESFGDHFFSVNDFKAHIQKQCVGHKFILMNLNSKSQKEKDFSKLLEAPAKLSPDYKFTL